MRISKIITFVIIVGAFVAGAYYRDDAVRFYNGFNKQVQSFQNTDVGKTITQASKQILTSTPLKVGGTSNNVVLVQSKIVIETNLQRQLNGNLPALTENSRLDEAAAAKANDMFLNQYFEHVSPSGVGPGDLAQKYGYDYIVEGENLILGNFSSEKDAVVDWMNSPGHRANILNTRYTEIGAAMIKGTYKGETVWIGVQEFGLPLSSCTQPDVNLKNQIDSEKMQLDELVSEINSRKNQIESTGKLSPAYRQMVEDYNQLVVQYNSLANEIKGIISKYNNTVNNFNQCLAGK